MLRPKEILKIGRMASPIGPIQGESRRSRRSDRGSRNLSGNWWEEHDPEGRLRHWPGPGLSSDAEAGDESLRCIAESAVRCSVARMPAGLPGAPRNPPKRQPLPDVDASGVARQEGGTRPAMLRNALATDVGQRSVGASGGSRTPSLSPSSRHSARQMFALPLKLGTPPLRIS